MNVLPNRICMLTELRDLCTIPPIPAKRTPDTHAIELSFDFIATIIKHAHSFEDFEVVLIKQFEILLIKYPNLLLF